MSDQDHRVHILAARLRVTISSRRGETPHQWVTNLAAQPMNPGDRPWKLDPQLTRRPWWRFK